MLNVCTVLCHKFICIFCKSDALAMLAREIIVHYRVALATEKERKLKEGVSVGSVFRAHTVSNLSL
jgi:hypothetical protein